MTDRDLAELHAALAGVMDSSLAYVRRTLGPQGWYGVEIRVGSDSGGDRLEIVHEVGLRGHDPQSLQVWGRGSNVDAALDEALEEMPVRRPRGWRRG